MCQNKKTKMVRHAFTLIELMVVMFVLAIAAAIVVPMASSAGTVQLRSAATMVAADLEYAKSMAISRGKRYSVVFNITTEAYRIEDRSLPVGDPGRIIDHPVKKGFKYLIDFRNDGRLDRVDIVTAKFNNNSTDTIVFDSLGSPYDGSDGPLNSGVITLQAGGLSRTVNVEPVTGFITVSN